MSRAFSALGLAAVTLIVANGASAAGPVVSATLDPPRTYVGGVVVYTVVATFGSEEEAMAARIEAPSGALAPIDEERLVRDGTRVSLTQHLSCLTTACVPGDESRYVQLPPPLVRSGDAVAVGDPVATSVVALVPAAAVTAIDVPWQRQTTLSEVTTIVPAAVVEVALAGAAAALAVAAVLVAFGGSRRRTPRDSDELDELKRALRLVRESVDRATPDRRRAAGLLSRVTSARGAHATASGADRVAWSRPEPAAADLHSLADTADQVSR